MQDRGSENNTGLEGELRECKGCYMAKGLRINQYTLFRAGKKPTRVLVDLSGFEWTEGGRVYLSGRKRYTLTKHGNFSRHLWVCFMHHTSDTVEFFEQLLADIVLQTVFLPRG